MRTLPCVLLLGVLLGLPASGATAPAEAPARLVFVKIFEGSAPDYMYVAVQQTGEALYTGQPDEEAREFRVSAGTVSRLFGMAASLGNFRGLQLESEHRVAYMGTKTFTFEQGSEKSTVSFNYTENEDAKELQRWFEAIARGRYLYAQLESRLGYDRLGIIPVIRELERDFNSGQIIDPQQFAPLLQQVVSDPQVARLAQTRAGEMLRRIQGGRRGCNWNWWRSPPAATTGWWWMGRTARSTRRASWRSHPTSSPGAFRPQRWRACRSFCN